MIESFEPGPARAEDLLLVGSLSKELQSEGWADITHWPGGLRARGRLRHTTFAVLHVRHQKERVRHALVRQAALGLLEHRARIDFADRLCLVTDAELDSNSLRLLS